MKHSITKSYKLFISLLCAFIVMLGMLALLPQNTMKAKAYYSRSSTYNCEGGYEYVSASSATTYSNYYSWITVTKVTNGYFKVTVKPDTNVRTINTYRSGSVSFKNSKGSTVFTLNIKQYQPYIYSSKYSLSISKNTTSYASLPISYNCKYTIEYPYNLIVKNSYGSTVTSGSTLGSNNSLGLSSTDYLKVYPRYANTSKYNKSYTIKIKKAGTTTVVKTINVTHTYY